MISAPDREMAVQLIDEAVSSGAACGLKVGIRLMMEVYSL